MPHKSPLCIALCLVVLSCLVGLVPGQGWALSSANIPLDSPIYGYLDKLAGFGLIERDVRGIKPYSKAEAARLMLEAGKNLAASDLPHPFAAQLLARIRELIPREVSLIEHPDAKPAAIDFNPASSIRLRYVYLDGGPRSYERPVHDPGGDGVFGIGSGLRPDNPYPSPVQQHGTEGTPLQENNDGVRYHRGSNGELRWAAEGYLSDKVAALLEPAVTYAKNDASAAFKINRGYVKLGGGWLELEAGKDENWLGPGYRGAITLTNNAENLTELKLSSPEPFRIGWLSWLGDMKYALIVSRLDRTVTTDGERQPWYYALKLSTKPTANLEVGFNLGREQGGPGVNNSLGDNLRGLVGGTSADNSNSLSGFEARYRIGWLRNTELYGEFSGEDTAKFWPIVESYVAGIFIPRLTADGRDDFRFEFFQGNQILYTNSTFPEGYLYKGMPLGHSQGGATQDFFARYSHWFSVRNTLALEYDYTRRGQIGRVKVDGAGAFDPGGTMQALERKHAVRVTWNYPVASNWDMGLTYGWEHIDNFNLKEGVTQINQIFTVGVSYRH